MSELIKLSYRERSRLELLLKSSPSARVVHRAQALLLLGDGEPVAEVAELLRVSRQTLYNWVTRFNQRSGQSVVERLADGARSGRPATAAGVIDSLIDAVIDSDPRDYAYNSTVWTAGLLRGYLAEAHRQEVSRRSVSAALARLGIRWKRPRHVLALRDPCWRQAKGGSNAASGGARARSS